MKFQIIVVVAFLVAAFALPQRSANDENQDQDNFLVGTNDHQAASNTENELIDNNLTSTNDITTGRPGCSRRRCEQNGNRKHAGAWRRTNSFRVNEEQLGLTEEYEGREQQENSVPNMERNITEFGKKHHRHHHRHHHHHHRNCTTTPPPSPPTTTTTTTPSTLLSAEVDEVFVRRHENDGTQTFEE